MRPKWQRDRMASLESSATDPDRPLHYIGTGVTAAWHRLQYQGAVMLFLGGIGLRLVLILYPYVALRCPTYRENSHANHT